ncbi:MAG: acyltransferase, partial [Acetobacteraceae bacterium]|nr:acyltransferase [Acetobacteraceae bacterium]
MLSWARNTFELQAGDRSRLLPMEGLRGFAVILVFLHHYSVQAHSIGLPPGPAAVTAAALHNYGNVGVELFFTLSGFLIYGTLVRHAPPFGSFMARRIQRIYPAYLAVLLFALALSVFGPGTRLLANPVHAIPLVLANVALLPGLFPIPPIVAVAWSLSYELFFYVAIAAVVLGAGLGVRSRGYRLTLLAGASLLFTIAGFAELPGYPIRMMPFFAGMFLAEGVGARIPGWLALVAAIAGFLASATHAF